MRADFYVYTHWLPGSEKPFYVGKGRVGRARSKRRTDAWWNKAQAEGFSVRYEREGLTEAEAYDLEKSLIRRFGAQVQGGCLVNLPSRGPFAKGAASVGIYLQKLGVRPSQWRRVLSDGERDEILSGKVSLPPMRFASLIKRLRRLCIQRLVSEHRARRNAENLDDE